MPERTMKSSHLKNILLFLLAVVFSIALMFAFTELPVLLDRLLQSSIGFPGFDHGLDEQSARMTDIYVSALHLRLIGYLCLGIILLLIILGFLTRRSGWALAGALALFLPVFGQFAISMFFLAGLGILRIGWLPLMDLSIQVLNLGQIAFLPFRLLMEFFQLFDWYAKDFLAWLFMALGTFLFVWGVLVWFQSRFRKTGVATAWIYRISRHPQYLGWILWSYGLVIFAADINQMKKSWGFSSSLGWLLMTMIIIGICMLEEIRMKKSHGKSYESYREKTPFLFPLPKKLVWILKAPMRLVIRKAHPERSREVAWIVLLYTGIFMGLSLFWVDFTPGEPEFELRGVNEPQIVIDSLLKCIDQEEERREASKYFEALGSFGEAAVDPLIGLLEDENAVNREFAAWQLGQLEHPRSIQPLLLALRDPEGRVRNQAVWSLGHIGSGIPVDSLLDCLNRDTLPVSRSIVYATLGNIRSPGSWDVLVVGLKDPQWWNRSAALHALYKIDSSRSLNHVYEALHDEHYGVRRRAVMILLERADPGSVPYLEQVLDDEDFETRFYARQALNTLRAGKTNR